MEIDQLPGIETRILAATHADLSRRLDALEHKAKARLSDTGFDGMRQAV